jgi:hypothetical protein
MCFSIIRIDAYGIKVLNLIKSKEKGVGIADYHRELGPFGAIHITWCHYG